MSSSNELITLTDALRRLPRNMHPSAALVTLVRTQGATFRRPGTHMLVRADGSVVGELSGGCPQRDIVLRAQEVITSGQPRLVNYNAESGLDVLMEMGCGGELEVLIEPLSAPHATRFAEPLAQCLHHRHSARLVTRFAIDNAVVMPRRALWCAEGLRFEDFACPTLLRSIEQAIDASDSQRAVTLRLPSADGAMDVLVECIAPPHALVAIGSGAVPRALIAVGDALGWRTTLVDADPQRLRAAQLPHSAHSVCANPHTLREALALDRHSSVVVMTHNLEQDLAWLAALRDVPIAYLGALGSRERVLHLRENASLAGINMHAPAGLDIGSETPAEIALAIAAEILATINDRDGAPLRDNEGPIHP